MKKGTIFTDVQLFLFSGEEKNQDNVFSSEKETFFFCRIIPREKLSVESFSVWNQVKKNKTFQNKITKQKKNSV